MENPWHSYETTDPESYERALSRVDDFESLHKDDQDVVFERVKALKMGTKPDGSDGMGAVEAIAQAMDERDGIFNPSDLQS